ncbi:MAG: rRNA maturation RNase YbeY [Treponema sp.]|jgi:probable rRNA maturation factor|nr:rRNA maturation RNase YbeY [Treponema sp.]
MNTITINAESVPLPPWTDEIEAFVQRVLAILGKDNWDLSVLFCDDTYIRTLNSHFRSKDEATDVLSFALGEWDGDRYLPGDIAVSLDTLKANAAYFGVCEGEEIRRLIVHGILHLDGMDHTGCLGAENEPMLILQEKILATAVPTY